MNELNKLKDQLCFMVQFYDIDGSMIENWTFPAYKVNNKVLKAYEYANNVINNKKDYQATIVLGYPKIGRGVEHINYFQRWEIDFNSANKIIIIDEIKVDTKRF